MPPKCAHSTRSQNALKAARPRQQASKQEQSVSDTERASVLRSIRNMQESGIPSFNTALREIKHGRKTSHWIWYVWPSLKALRPGTSRPFFLLPDFDTARMYLRDEILRERLHESTRLAVTHLQRRVQPKVLFSSETDAAKFEECMSTFALAAAEDLEIDTLELCIDALEALTCHGCLAPRVLEALEGAHRFSGVTLARDLRVALDSNSTRYASHQSLANSDPELESSQSSRENKLKTYCASSDEPTEIM